MWEYKVLQVDVFAGSELMELSSLIEDGAAIVSGLLAKKIREDYKALINANGKLALPDVLKHLGSQGWEMTAATLESRGPAARTQFLYFKKPKTS
jgi:hypothetical protein